MAKFCDTFRHYLLNNYVCVTAFDSGNLYLSDEDIKLGWQNIDNVATSPKIKADTELPSAGFDEWYIFTKRPATLKLADVYVNYSSFNLEDSSELLRKFWHDIEFNQPNIYVADGDGLKIVTTDEALKQEIETSWC